MYRPPGRGHILDGVAGGGGGGKKMVKHNMPKHQKILFQNNFESLWFAPGEQSALKSNYNGVLKNVYRIIDC